MSLSLAFCYVTQAQNVESFGVFGGLNVPITVDQGLQKDTRFVGKLTLRATPIGFTYGYDHVGYGFLVTPSFTQIGQKYIIKNTTGGEVGERDIQMNYISVPVALKLHVNDLSFFRLSVLAAINLNYLIQGKETYTFSESKLLYPDGVLIPSDPGYVETYDGVLVPEENDLVYVSNDKFVPFQIFGALGLHSDFDLNDDWSLNFDGRANFGLLDPRKKDYIEQLQMPADKPDLYGARRDVYLSAMIGISRIIQIKKEFKPRRTGSSITKRHQSPKHKRRRKN
jgi:hypothetical protein